MQPGVGLKRVLGIDPGLTRCGVGVVDVSPDRKAHLVYVGVIRTPPELALEERVLAIGLGLAELLDEHQPHVVALERVFAQQNVQTVMSVAQASGVAMFMAAQRGLAVALHTPSEVKAAITGYGSADKKQVANMVAKVLRLDAPPTPADAADALAIAICHAWRSPGATVGAGAGAALTPAQRAWRDAEKSTRGR